MTPPLPDHLRTWLDTRESVPWHEARLPVETGPGAVIHDGAAHDIRTHDQARSSERAAGLLASLDLVRADAASGVPLGFTVLSVWQTRVLDVAHAPFRHHPAFAKDGRERYGCWPGIRDHFDTCLGESEGSTLPLPARAARAYLDVCFFHPFDDGNARAAFLALTFTLERAGVVLDQVGPLCRIPRQPDDPQSALALANLVAVLIDATRRRGRPAVPPGPARADQRGH